MTGCCDSSPVGSICRHLLSEKHNGVEIQASCAMIVCMLIPIYTGGKPNKAMHQMVWYYLLMGVRVREAPANPPVADRCPARAQTPPRERRAWVAPP